jgi:gluconolactonase
MKVDVQGNIYSAGPGGVVILSPEGKRLATLLIPERVANVAWGGPDRRTLYICASSSVYRVKLLIAGEPIAQSK